MRKRSFLSLAIIYFVFSSYGCNNMIVENNIQKENNIPGYPTPNFTALSSDIYPGPGFEKKEILPNEIISFPEIAKPLEDKTSFGGVLYSYSNKQLITNNAYYLMPSIGELDNVPPFLTGPNENQGDIAGFSDENGFIIINNINPGKYYLVVWSPYSWLLAEKDLDNKEPLLLELSENEVNNQGIIYLPFQ